MSVYDEDETEASLCRDPDDKSSSKNEICGEYETLRIMHKFKRFYEQKLEEIDTLGGGDCLELKLKVQQKWIEDLTEQTEMMARIVKELEDEATDRVKKLEDKLRQTSKYANEVMKRYQSYNITHNLDEPFQKVFYLENDVKNLLEFVRRIRDDGRWSIDGLQFYDVTYNDLFGSNKHNNDLIDSRPEITVKNDANDICEVENATPNQRLTSIEEISEQLAQKNAEYENLKQTMLDMRNALTEEVACKHDMISSLKRDILQLEERCVQADKQTAFKDDIIKELRKEIKQLKQQIINFKHAAKKKLSNNNLFIVKHKKKSERSQCSSIIFLNESENECLKEKQQSDQLTTLQNYDTKEIPTKEKSKFTLINSPKQDFSNNIDSSAGDWKK